MYTQHYKLKARMVHLVKAAPGQIVYDESGTRIVGFIDFVSDSDLSIMLFEPILTPMNENFTHISDTCDWETRLQEIMADDFDMNEMWNAIMTPTDEDENDFGFDFESEFPDAEFATDPIDTEDPNSSKKRTYH